MALTPASYSSGSNAWMNHIRLDNFSSFIVGRRVLLVMNLEG